MTHQTWIQVAERIDSLRVFPRLFLVACFWFTVKVTMLLLAWYTHLPAAERGIEGSGFGAIVLLGIMAFLKLVYTTYSDAGRAWGPAAPATSTTLVQTTQTTGAAP